MVNRSKILVLCTGNSCRSIMGEALINHLEGDRFEAFSAGSHPTGAAHPLALETLRRNGISSVGSLRSKSWDEYKDIAFNIVITVCEHARDENCPYFANASQHIHCGVRDPAGITGSTEEMQREFQVVFEELRASIYFALGIKVS